MTDKLLEIKDLEIIYKTDREVVHAVNGISFSLSESETLGLVGETGAGKTTTALSLLRLLPERTAKVTGGEIQFKGRNIMELSQSEMRKIRGEQITMIFQDPMTALNPMMTIGKQIAEALRYHDYGVKGHEAIEKRVEEVLELVGIPAFRKNDYPHQFSGGMKQRVVIAIALACEPELLIADEPTTALDVTIQAQVLSMINELRERLKMAMIMITHDLGIIAETCDKVAVMYSGEIVEYGTMEDIFAGDFHHPYTDGLFKSIPSLDTKTKRLKPIDGLMPDPTNLPEGCKFHPRCPYCMDICTKKKPGVYTKDTHTACCHLFTKEN